MVARSARRQEQLGLAASLRAGGAGPVQIAAALRDRYGLNGRVAMRTAHGLTQAELARRWTTRWPDDPRTFKNISYWENWPSPTGHAPSLAVLDRLALLLHCDVADLVAGWGEHSAPPPDRPTAEPETMAWQVGHLDLHELTRAIADWSVRLPEPQRRSLLLKLSTAAAVAAAISSESAPRGVKPEPGLRSLVGRWSSSYGYASASRGTELDGHHIVDLRVEGGLLVGRSRPQPTGSVLHLALDVHGTLATGRWTERTSPTGHYRAATYHGLIQLVVDPTSRSMSGRWLGLSKRFTIKSGTWRLDWLDQSDPPGPGPVTTATTDAPRGSAPSAIIEKVPSIILPT
jgi:transcriptional regulator with XRE-family HTH domain